MTIQLILSIFLTFSLLNLSVEAWSSNVLLIEINEEVENVIEGSVLNDAWTNDATSSFGFGLVEIPSCHGMLMDDRVSGCDYFAIDSPPPKAA